MVVVISGASSGIGESTAKYFSNKGDKVYSLSRRIKQDKDITYLSCDITDINQIKESIKKIIELEGKIDLLINNAGMGISGAVEYHSEDEINKIINVNLVGLVNLTKEVIPYLRKSKGIIINISSVAGILAIPFQAMYSASKAAIISFSDALKNELRPFKVRVTSVLPGDTKTGFTEAREKSLDHNEYGNRINNSVSKMEKDEQKGVSPIKVSKVIYKVSKKKNPNTYYIVGFSYKLLVFLSRILPKRLVNYILYKLYGN